MQLDITTRKHHKNHHHNHNPFDCELSKIKTEQLAAPREEAEGWYVEYKSELTPAKKIAKSLAAFANQYGGWLLYGIQETQDSPHVAGSFPGINKSDIPRAIERIRDAARNSINPSYSIRLKAFATAPHRQHHRPGCGR